MQDKLERLFEPIDIGVMRLKNRLVMAPLATNFADEQGAMTPRLIEYYAERARHGVGMITIEFSSVSATGKPNIYQLGAYKDDFIPGLKKLAQAVKQYDCRCTLQIHHAGRRAPSKLNNGAVPVAPSPIPCVGREMPRELTLDEIGTKIEEFANAALRAKKAGFDAVELHGAHGYLIAQFLSPLSNKRTDKYGGTLEKRTRFITEIISRIKDKVGNDYPILAKISVNEYVPGGLTPDEARIIARILEDAGANAMIASAGHTGASAEAYAGSLPGADSPRGCYAHLAEALKRAVSVPVGAVGRINDPVVAENILQENKADLIYMARAFLADPELPAKAMQGRLEDIRVCIACGMCVKTLAPESEKTNLSCTVNAALGREAAYQIVRAKRPKRVLVIGGGPAGMEAARVASMRGHQVTLYEKGDQLGGQLLLAAIPPHKDEIPNLVRYLSTQIKKLGVSLELGKEVTLTTVEQLKADAIVVATGSVPCMPDIRGVSGDNVAIAEDILTGKAQVKNTEVVVLGGGIVGCETAEFLATKGKHVTIVEALADVARDLDETVRLLLIKRLREYGVTILTDAKVKRITRQAVVLENGSKIIAGTVVLAVGRKATNELAQSLKGTAGEIYTIGDCVQPRMIIDAIAEGAAVGLKIGG